MTGNRATGHTTRDEARRERDTFPTQGVFDQGVREWLRDRFRALRDAGLTPEAARTQTERDATATFGRWRAER